MMINVHNAVPLVTQIIQAFHGANEPKEKLALANMVIGLTTELPDLLINERERECFALFLTVIAQDVALADAFIASKRREER